MRNQTMLAVRLHEIGVFRTDRVPIPVPHGQELLIKIGACGVCGSDLQRIYDHGSSNNSYPLTLGHEFSGTIVAVGEEADPELIGRRGAFQPLIPCRKCDSCLSGHYNMCENYNYMGSRRDGGFAEYCLVPSHWHFVESNNPQLSFEQLAMVEPACVAQHAVLRRSNMFAGANILIIGAGPIGIMAGRWANLAGASHVLMLDVVDEKVLFARSCGFSAYNSTNNDLEKVVLETFGGQFADISVEGTGYGSALENAIQCSKHFATITLLGNPVDNTSISSHFHSMLLRKEITIQGIWNSHYANTPINEWKYTVDMMDKGNFYCEDLVSHKCSLITLPDVIKQMYERTISPCKVLYVADSSFP